MPNAIVGQVFPVPFAVGAALQLKSNLAGSSTQPFSASTITATDANLGAAITSLVGFHGTAGTARASAYTQTYVTASKTHAALTSTVIAAVVPVAAPAGGVGAAAGAWDTAANRDIAIATINGMRDHSIEVELDLEALLADVTNLKQVVNALIDDLQAKVLVG